jgi:hypothetical protein
MSKWHKSTPVPLTNKTVFYKGFGAKIEELINKGWLLEIVINLFTGTKYLYIRDKQHGLVGRGKYKDNSDCITLDFLCNEKNKRIKTAAVLVEEIELYITEDNIEFLLNEIAKIQQTKLTPRPMRPRPTADILEFVKQRSNY